MAVDTTIATLLTADDLLAMPDDGYRYELDKGKLVRLPMSSNESSDVAGGILTALRVFAYPQKLGRVSGADGAYILRRDPYTVRIPDVAFVLAHRMPPREERRRFLELAPDLAVEVVSPSDSSNEVHAKVLEYLNAGVQVVWVVHPIQRTVTIYTDGPVARVLDEHETLDGGELLPGFALAVSEIFE